MDENGNPIEPSGSNWRFSDADNSVWWRWTAPTSNPYVFSVGAPFNQSQAAVYTGTSLENLTELVSIGEFSNFSIPDDFENFGDPVDTTAGTPYNIQIDIHRFQGPYSLSIAEGSNIDNDNIANATPIDNIGSYWSTNIFATVETNEPSGSNWNSQPILPGQSPYEVANTIWWRWSEPATGIYSFSTENSGSTETYIAIYLDDGTEIASSDGFGVFDTISNVNLNSENDYLIQVAGPNDFGGYVQLNVECFLPGTNILTDKGEVAVEDLNIGDLVETADGKLEPVKWIGKQTVEPDRIKNPLRGYPILIKAGALGHGLPHRDLYTSPDHAYLVDGLLINAGALVNDVSIIKTEPTETFCYYHVELENHSLLLAEGTAAESFYPNREDRLVYYNGAEYDELYPDGNSQLMLYPLDYPRISSKNKVPKYISQKLMQIAEELDLKVLQVV